MFVLPSRFQGLFIVELLASKSCAAARYEGKKCLHYPVVPKDDVHGVVLSFKINRAHTLGKHVRTTQSIPRTISMVQFSASKSVATTRYDGKHVCTTQPIQTTINMV